MRNILLISLLLLVALGCKKKLTTYEKDDLAIREYLKKTNIQATKHSTGLYYIIEKEGNGVFPTTSDNIEVKTLGYYLDSVVFQKDTNPIIGPLSSFVYGWQYGIPLFSEGGKGKLFLPSNLGYGKDVLVFDIELRNVF